MKDIITNLQYMKENASQDREYLEAVESGNLEKAQTMVDVRAKERGYTIGPVYHGTNHMFNVFDKQFSYDGKIWAAGDKQSIEQGESGAQKTTIIMSWYVHMNRKAGWDKYGKDSFLSQNFDGAILPEKDGTFTVFVFHSEQIKFTDSVTYDDQKNIIPLSQRFNFKSKDIRY